MAVPRPLLLALVGMVLLSAVFLGTRSMRGQTSASHPSVPATQRHERKPAAKPHVAAPPARPAPKAHAGAPARSSRTRARPARRASAAPTGKPALMAKAIARGNVVVLFLFQPGGGDDLRVAQSVAALRGERGVAVLSDTIEHIGGYGTMVGDLGVSEAPAIVIVDRHRRAHLLEGYVDPETLTQEVADIRR
jgi:hypothetical protein